MRYDVTACGLVGDGVTLNDVALAVLLGSAPDGSVFYFPSGKYVFASTIDLSARKLWTFEGDGFRGGQDAPGSTLFGNVAGPLIKYIPSGSTNTWCCENIGIRNTNPTGTCFQSTTATPTSGGATFNCVLRGVQMAGNVGLNASWNNFCLAVEQCKFNGQGLIFPNSIGAVSNGGISFKDCDFTGWKEGCRLSGGPCNVFSSRFEVNGTGLRLGVYPDGGTYAMSDSVIMGNEFEGNDTGIEVVDLRNSSFMANGISGNLASFSGGTVHSAYGINDHGSSQVSYHTTVTNGNFTGAAVWLHTSYDGYVGWYDCFASNREAGAPVWLLQSGLANTRFTGCNKP